MVMVAGFKIQPLCADAFGGKTQYFAVINGTFVEPWMPRKKHKVRQASWKIFVV